MSLRLLSALKLQWGVLSLIESMVAIKSKKAVVPSKKAINVVACKYVSTSLRFSRFAP